MKRRRWLRALKVLALSAVVLSAFMAFLFWWQLPSWHSVSNALRWTQSSPVSAPAAVAASAPVATPAPVAVLAPSPTPARRAPGTLSPAGTVASYLTDRFVNGSGSDIRVCETLIDAAVRPPTNPGAFDQALAQRAAGNADDNVFVESALAAIGGVLKIPSVGQIVQSMQTAATNNDPDYANGEQFRSQLALAAADVLSNRVALEEISQHAYHLFVISRLVALNPAMANDSETLALCSRIESLASQPAGSLDLDSEKAALLRMLAQSGVSPEQVGYDPNLENPVRATMSSAGVNIAIPWMMKQFGSTLRIANSMSQASVSGTTSR